MSARAGVEGTRTYHGRTVEELIPLIQAELGDDALILRRREGLAGGFLGFFQHAFVEIDAMPGGPRIDVYDEQHSAAPPQLAAELPSPPAAAPQPPRAPAAAPRSQPSRPSYAPAAAPYAAAELHAPAARPPHQLPPPPYRPGPAPAFAREPSTAPGGGGPYVTAHLAALARYGSTERRRGVVPSPAADFEELLARDLPGPFAPPRGRPEASEPPPARPVERRTVAPGSHSRARAGVEKSLLRFGISRELAGELIDGAAAHALALAPRAGLAEAVRSTLAQRIPVAPALPSRGAAIVLVGAGGAGKTTCCAALLGAYRKNSSLPASFATLSQDAHRGGLELTLSPHIMRPTPAHTPRAMRALRRVRADGLAVLDTPGLSAADRAGVRAVAGMLGELQPERVVVALPATLGATAAAQLLTALAPLNANAIAVTHADETDQLGVAVEAACAFGLAPEYMLQRGRSGGWKVSRLEPTTLAATLLP
jgi:flagellar biosynthesis GTPase FlhF